MKKIKLIEGQTLDVREMKSIVGGEDPSGITITCPIPKNCSGYYNGVYKVGGCVYQSNNGSAACGCFYYANGEPHPLTVSKWSDTQVSCWETSESGSGN